MWSILYNKITRVASGTGIFSQKDARNTGQRKKHVASFKAEECGESYASNTGLRELK